MKKDLKNRESVETTRKAPKRTFTIKHRKKLSEARKGKSSWNKGLTKDDPRVLKNTLATQANPNLRKNLSKALMGHKSTFNRKHTKEEIEKIRITHTGKKHNYKVWNKGLTKENSNKMRSIAKNISKALLLIPKEIRCENSRKARMSMKVIKVSSFEDIITKELDKTDINFISQYKINIGNMLTFVDFFFPDTNTCLYIDGIYWHNRPEVIKRDKKANKILKLNGYKVKRFIVKTKKDVQLIIKIILDGDIVRHSK